MVNCKKESENGSQQLALSDFGAEFWDSCLHSSMAPPPYQRGPRSFELYKELIGPFTGLTESTIPISENLGPEQLLVLAAPVRAEGQILRINDPIFPVEVSMPGDYQMSCQAILEILKTEPVVQLKRLQNLMTSSHAAANDDVINWMLTAGILLRTRPMNPSLDPTLIADKMSKPVFTIQTVDYKSDVFVLKQIE